MLLHCLAASTSVGAIGSVTQSSILTGSATTSQSSTLGLPLAPSGTFSWCLDSSTSFYMTPHPVHLSSMCSPYHHVTVQIADGLPLCIAGQGTLCSDSFYVPDISLVPNLTMQFMSARQIIDHNCHVILDPDFCYIQHHHTGHLVGTGPRSRDSQRLWELDWLHLPSTAPASLASPVIAASSTPSFSQWHHHMCHLCGS
jgi:hypothetical protein